LQQTQDFPSLQISQPLPRSQHLEALQRSATWLDLKFEQTLQQLLQGSPEEHVVCGASTITAEIQDYMTTIGQVDQTLAGELHDLDPYLEPDLPHHSPARYSFPLTTSKPSPSQNSQPSNPTVRERASIVDPTVVDPTVVDPTVVAFAVDFPADPAIVEPTIAPPIEPSPAAPPVRVPEPIPARAGTILLSEKMISNWIQQWLQRQSGLELEAITAEVVFADYGMDSVLAIELVRDLETWLQISLDATLLWNFPTLGSLAQYLFQLAAGKASDLAPENRGKNIDTSHDPKVSLPAPSPTLPASPTPQPELVSPVNLEMAVATELAQLEALLQE
jgi:acyl carrier protein